jgi:hypothetical protein
MIKKILGNVTNVMLFFRSKGVATPLLRKNSITFATLPDFELYTISL